MNSDWLTFGFEVKNSAGTRICDPNTVSTGDVCGSSLEAVLIPGMTNGSTSAHLSVSWCFIAVFNCLWNRSTILFACG